MTQTVADGPAAPAAPTQSRPLERLEAEIVSLSSEIAAASCRLLLLVGEYDDANGAREWGMTTTASWLSWQCGLSRCAAREQVRVARALRELPLVTAEFAAGRLSYSKVRAITRAATPETEADLVAWAMHATAAQLERLVAAQRRVLRAEDVRVRHAARYLSYRWDEDGSLVGSFRLPPEQATILLAALDAAKEEFSDGVTEYPASAEAPMPAEALPGPLASIAARSDTPAEASDTPQISWEAWQRSWSDLGFSAVPSPNEHPLGYLGQARPAVPDSPMRGDGPYADAADAADALTALASTYLGCSRDERRASPRGDDVLLVLHASAEALRSNTDDHPIDAVTTADGVRLHPETARRWSCDCSNEALIIDTDGTTLHLGPRTRRIRGRLARAVAYRDRGHCQAPGCTANTTQIHHVRHWSRGGSTCLTNLISLCDRHHWLVHEGGWYVTPQPHGTWRFFTADGQLLEP